ncbi:MAG: type I DNA topoisomerase [Paludibacteraceae bacterium]|nr:type I DNA topoisomerase [Paludibacteraceae bacterium]
MSKNLVIVESPAKAKTIEKILGKDYHVMSSQGHIRDIEGVGKKNIGIDFENGYAPNYVIDPNKKELIASMRKEAQKAEKVLLASDEDREGEAIAWHLQEVLELDPKKTERIAFHEITESAIKEAILHPRSVDYNLVNAQQARRVLDRIVGFELSPILWRKIVTGLSAGRVQSVAVRLIVEKEREIEEFKETSQYRVLGSFVGKNADEHLVKLHTELNHRFNTKDEVIDFLDQCQVSKFRIGQIQTKPSRHTPAPPFTTSTLQQEAVKKLHFSISKTMRLAQSLYEAGQITYMRTDSVNLSSLALGACKKEIVTAYGEKYHQARQYKTSNKGAQEAHEAIRPTYMSNHTAGSTPDEQKLYDLIWKRTLASQMADAQIEITRIEVVSDEMEHIFVATGETMLFDGFSKVYVQSDDEDETNRVSVPKMREGALMNGCEYVGRQTFTKAPFRYTEGTLIKKMEDLEIGRPSTYVSIVETIQSRHYVKRSNVQGKQRNVNVISITKGVYSDQQVQETYGQETGKLIPTDLGRMTNDFLVEQFPDIMSYGFTAQEEKTFDSIAEGVGDWVEAVDAFYRQFHPLIDSVPAGHIAGRLLGNEPQTGAPVIAKISKVGPCIQIGDADQGKPRFASLKEGQSLYTITLKEALELFDDVKNRALFLLDGEEVVYGVGKYGPYIKFKGKFVSVPRGVTPDQLTPDKVRELLAEADNKAPLKQFGDMQILRGRYGLYIKDANGNYPLPRHTKIDALTEEECKQIVINYKPTKKNAR